MFLVALGLVGLLFGVGSSEVRRFENAAARDISSRLEGSAKQVKVRTKMDPFQAVGGHLKSATVTASAFSTSGLPFFVQPEGSQRGRLDELKMQLADFELTGLRVKSLDVRIPGCRFDFGLAQRKGRVRLTKSGVGKGTVEVTEDALRDFVLKRSPAIQTMAVHLKNGFVEIDGRGKFGLFQARVRVVGRLVTPDGNLIEIVDAKAMIDDTEATPETTALLLKQVNPVLDLDRELKLFGALRVQKIELEGGILRAEGIAIVPNEPLGTGLDIFGLILP
jgi:hypothetical protein